MMQNNHNFIPMGKIVGAFGILGWVKIKVDTEHLTSLLDYQRPHLLINNSWLPTKIENHSIQNDVLQVKLKDVNNRDQAIALKGVVIGIDRSEFPKLDDNEYYWTDLIGLSVVNLDNENLGIVEDLMETGANGVLVIKNDTKQYLVPFVDEYIKIVDLAQRKITVDWGLDY